MTMTTTEALEVLQHEPHCDRPGARTKRDPSGRVYTRCRSCKAFVWHDDRPSALMRLAPKDSPYRCRTHLEQPITWRGTGCPECQREAAQRRPRTWT